MKNLILILAIAFLVIFVNFEIKAQPCPPGYELKDITLLGFPGCPSPPYIDCQACVYCGGPTGNNKAVYQIGEFDGVCDGITVESLVQYFMQFTAANWATECWSDLNGQPPCDTINPDSSLNYGGMVWEIPICWIRSQDLLDPTKVNLLSCDTSLCCNYWTFCWVPISKYPYWKLHWMFQNAQIQGNPNVNCLLTPDDGYIQNVCFHYGMTNPFQCIEENFPGE